MTAFARLDFPDLQIAFTCLTNWALSIEEVGMVVLTTLMPSSPLSPAPSPPSLPLPHPAATAAKVRTRSSGPVKRKVKWFPGAAIEQLIHRYTGFFVHSPYKSILKSLIASSRRTATQIKKYARS